MPWFANMNLRKSFNYLIVSDLEAKSFPLCVSGLSYLKLTFALTSCWDYDIEKDIFTLVTKSKAVMYNTLFSLLAMSESPNFSNTIF